MTTATAPAGTREKERATDAIRTLGGIPADDVAQLLRDTLALQTEHQDQMDHLANFDPQAVNTPGTLDHGMYERARASRDALTAPILGLQALLIAAERY